MIALLPAAQPIAEEVPIVVTANRTAVTLDPKPMRDTVAAFARHRAAFAPSATLRFRVKGDAPIDGLRLRLVASDGRRMGTIAPAADRNFARPAIPLDGLRLLANRPANSVIVEPVVRSPGSRDGDERLGDVRLACRVGMAFVRTTLSFGERAFLAAAGDVCARRNFAVTVDTTGPIRRADLVEGARTAAIAVAPSRRAYRLPTADRRFGNDARMIVDTQ